MLRIGKIESAPPFEGKEGILDNILQDPYNNDQCIKGSIGEIRKSDENGPFPQEIVLEEIVLGRANRANCLGREKGAR